MAKSIDASPPRKSGRPLGRVRGSKLINGKVFSPGDELPKPRGFLPGPKVVVVKVNPLSEGPKRGRGRPRKSHNEIDLQVNEDGDDGAELGDDEDSMVVKETEIDAMVIDEGNTRPTNITKRGRGRPPKNTAVHTPAKTPLNPGQALNVNLNESDQSIHQVKRSRGRPRKFALSTDSPSSSMANSTPATPTKRGPGRPPKKGVARRITKNKTPSRSPTKRGAKANQKFTNQLSTFIDDENEKNKQIEDEDKDHVVMDDTTEQPPLNAFTTVQNTHSLQLMREMDMGQGSRLSSQAHYTRGRSVTKKSLTPIETAAPMAPMTGNEQELGTAPKYGCTMRLAKSAAQVPNDMDNGDSVGTEALATSAMAMVDAFTSTEGAEADNKREAGVTGGF